MKFKNLALYVMIGVIAFSIGIFLTGCATTNNNGGGDSNGQGQPHFLGIPTVTNRDHAADAVNVPINYVISVIFSKEMNPTTINTETFTVERIQQFPLPRIPVTGTVVPVGTAATFIPDINLIPSALYTVTITTGARDMAGNALLTNHVWSFRTGTGIAQGPVPVNLGTAGDFVILSKSGITDVPASVITGNVGTSPITGAANHLSCPEVTGSVYSVDAAGPAPCSIMDPTRLTTSVSDMETAYTDAAGRVLPDFTELGAGDISAMTLAPGLYKWSTGVHIDNRGVTLSGSANDVWIFQIAQDLTVDSTAVVTLGGTAQASNIFWQVGGDTGVTLGTTSVVKGNILAIAGIVVDTGATLNGRALAQTAVTLDHSVVGP